MKAVPVIALPDERTLAHFPEAALLALLDAVLVATAMTLRAEHPTVDEVPLDPEHDVAPSLLTAHLLLGRAEELRDLIRIYTRSVERAVGYHLDPDDGRPF